MHVYAFQYIMYIIYCQDKVTQTDVSKYLKLLENSSPFNGLETKYLQHKYYKEHFNYLASFHSCEYMIYTHA